MNVTITKDFGTGKANAQAKANLTELIMNALIAEFGEENVAMVRTGGTSQVNEIGVRIGTITDTDGFTYDFCATINPTIKGFKDRVTKRYTVEAFDFETAVACYENYLAEKAAKQAEAAAKKVERKANGNKTKSEKQAEIDARAKELDEIAKKVKEKQKAELAEKVAKAKEKAKGV